MKRPGFLSPPPPLRTEERGLLLAGGSFGCIAQGCVEWWPPALQSLDSRSENSVFLHSTNPREAKLSTVIEEWPKEAVKRILWEIIDWTTKTDKLTEKHTWKKVVEYLPLKSILNLTINWAVLANTGKAWRKYGLLGWGMFGRQCSDEICSDGVYLDLLYRKSMLQWVS